MKRRINPFPNDKLKEFAEHCSFPFSPREDNFREESIILSFNPLPHDKILDWSKLKEIADDISKCI